MLNTAITVSNAVVRKAKSGGNPFYNINRISELTCKERVSALRGGNKTLILALGKMHNDN